MPNTRKMIAVLTAVIACGLFAFAQGEDAPKEGPKPKHTIKEVMKGALKGNALNKKVLSGEASMEEKVALLDMYISLAENKPPRGEAASWQKLAGGAQMAAAKVVAGREGAMGELKKATNCAACHKAHKPPSE